jgi:ATP-dependent Zn protease
MELDTVKVHEGGHALVYMKLAKRAPLRFTIIPRGMSGGHVAFPENFETLVTKEHLTMRLAVLMGGSASTFVLRNGQEDSGIAMDVEMATKVAVQMVTQYGMSPLGMFHLPTLQQAGLLSEDFKLRILQEVQKLIDEGKKTAFAIVNENRAELDKLVAAIDEHETLLEPDFKRIFNMTYADEEPTAPKAAAITATGGNHE